MERIQRTDDENLYNPKIHSKRIRALHIISEKTNVPMTKLVDQALEGFIMEFQHLFVQSGATINEDGKTNNNS